MYQWKEVAEAISGGCCANWPEPGDPKGRFRDVGIGGHDMSDEWLKNAIGHLIHHEDRQWIAHTLNLPFWIPG